ncbi:type VI secretion system Vgr family protein [Acinetobacter vivianii]|uniref:type VI secretion system Vgr family protein n=1 Tax=Acinetobacter vivianii TaxID=1776742 RepID=UPI002DB806D6|nr:type VI secretion system Vgr family protein [Acinetobacter vivianii]MEB6479742.1 type VI secretion system tip protein VgrG [Acinetobacter vivianii]MEB6658496.1 type VI secretion system tip protein VgrG [Acinetobacter vivianii]
MLFNIFNVLEKIGLNAQKRAIHIQFSNQLLNNQIFLQRIEGQHQLNAGLEADLICLSTNAQIPLKQFIGVQVAVDQVTDSGQLFRTTGIVTEASYGQSDGALTLYKLTIKDATSLWHQRRNSRVFMNKSIVEITEVLFKEWQQKSPLFAASLGLDLNGLSQNYDIRPFVMGHNESDYAFLTRLWRSEGISWLIDEAELFVPHSSTPIKAQKLRLMDDNSEYQALPRRSIRYHRSSATEFQDSITGFVAVRSLQPTAVHLQRWQPDALAQEEGAGLVVTTHNHSESFDSASLSLEQAWHISPAWMQDLKGEDQATASGSSQLEKLNQQLNDMYASQAKYFKAYSSVRDSQVGYWFNLREHPEIDQHEGADQEFLIIAKHFYNQNNLPKDLQQQVSQLLSQSRWDQHGYDEAERQGNELTLIRRQIKIIPEYDPELHRPVAYPQRAKVVGPEGETIYVDEWGRIKVRFLFTRSEDHGHDGGAGSNDNDTDSAWVDVLIPWAGEGYGARFLPRIGEVVVIDFFDGNIDRPFVTGRIHEAQRSPTKFDVKGQLPDTKKLSGIRSQEVNGSGFNQLRFDDTTGQISTQLQSSHAASQLNLGNLSHPKTQETSDGRGEGFELRTDAWGAVRASKGLFLSTQKQEQAQGEHLEALSAKQQLQANESNAKALSEVARNQQTDEIQSVEKIKEFAAQIEEKIAKFNKALLLLSSPNGIGLSSNEAIHISSDGQIDQFAGDSINFSTQKNLIAHAQNRISLFAAQHGIKQVAAKGKFEVQSQSDGIALISKGDIQIISTEDTIYITSPKEILFNAGTSQLKLNDSGIFPTTGGKFEVKAGQHVFEAGANIVLPKISLPTVKTLFSNQLNYNWNIKSEGKKEIFIIDQKSNRLIKTKTDQLDPDNKMSSLRFHTPQARDFTALIFNSDIPRLKQDVPDSENIDELLEEVLLDEESDEVYTEEDSEQ